MRAYKRLLGCSALLLLLASCAVPRPADPQKAEALRRQAEEQAAAGGFAAAADSAGAAIAQARADGSLYYLRGALLERIDQLPAARATYQAGLQNAPSSDPGRQELVWRLGLLSALRLEDVEAARVLLRSLPAGSPPADDLEGLILLQTGDLAAALEHLERALIEAPDQEFAATVLYHLALAHYRGGDEEKSLGHLFHAAPRARHFGLVGDLERLWRILSATAPPPVPSATIK